MSLAHSVSRYNRRRKWNIFLEAFRINPAAKILDAGFSDAEYSKTDNFLEKNYPYPENITALGLVEPVSFNKRYPWVQTIKYNGHLFPFSGKEFDICWSNAVLEHVGGKQEQTQFLKEIARVADVAFITTPNRFFPIEVHTRIPLLHFLPKRFFDVCLRLLGKTWATGNYMNLLSLVELNKLLDAAGIKKYQIKENKLLGFTLDFVIIL
jgi:SAM-dependent methyltransferase